MVRFYIRVRKEDELFGIGRVRIEYDYNGYEYGTSKVRIKKRNIFVHLFVLYSYFIRTLGTKGVRMYSYPNTFVPLSYLIRTLYIYSYFIRTF